MHVLHRWSRAVAGWPLSISDRSIHLNRPAYTQPHIETGEKAVPPEDTLVIIRILAAAEKPTDQGGEVAVKP